MGHRAGWGSGLRRWRRPCSHGTPRAWASAAAAGLPHLVPCLNASGELVHGADETKAIEQWLEGDVDVAGRRGQQAGRLPEGGPRIRLATTTDRGDTGTRFEVREAVGKRAALHRTHDNPIPVACLAQLDPTPAVSLWLLKSDGTDVAVHLGARYSGGVDGAAASPPTRLGCLRPGDAVR